MKMKQLLRFRTVWMGCAMLWIMLAHSGFDFGSPLFVYLKMWGYGGVDICLLASGIGCYFSLEKDPDSLRFLKRRAVRLVPTYFCFMIVWSCYRMAVSELSWQAVLGNLLGVQSFTGLSGSFSWYISALVLTYLLAPYFKNLADRVKGLGWQLLVVGVLILLSVAFWRADNWIIMMTRLPIFYIGMLVGKACKEDRQLEKKHVVLSVLMLLAGVVLLYAANRCSPEQLWSYGLYWYPFILVTPGLCVVISLVFSWLERVKWLNWIRQLVEWVGRNSFEVYLVHVFLYEEVLPNLGFSQVSVNQNLLWLTTIPMVILGCWLLKSAAKLVQNLANRIQ